jgi:oligosaccharide repeat unit polymerase
MTIFITICIGCAGILLGRFVFHKWFNHISLYTSIWAGTLILFELRLINYYPLEPETWIVIVTCWLIFLLGSMTVAVARSSTKKDHALGERIINPSDKEKKIKKLKHVLWLLNIATLAAALYNLYLVSEIFGSLSNAFVFGNLLYSYRVSEGLPGSIPYISSLVFTAALLAGSYTAQTGKITFASVLPLIIIIIIDFTYMGRADILVVTILFASAYFLTHKEKNTYSKKLHLRKLGMLIIIVAIVLAGAEFIRSTRQAKETFRGSTTTLKKLSEARVFTPSIYLYLTADYGVLNRYLQRGGENTPIGGHTFLTLYRIFERLGLEVRAETYQSWYKTPLHLNTGTYLRELHGDFGVAGLLFGPYLIGILSSVFWYRLKERGGYINLAIAGFLYTIIGMSFFVMITRLSPFFFYLFVSVIVCWFLDKKSFAMFEYRTRF